jgi:hypothetical protein
MGQSASHATNPDRKSEGFPSITEDIPIEIQFTSKAPTMVGQHVTTKINTSDLRVEQTVAALARRLLADALHNEVYIVIRLGPSFYPTAFLSSIYPSQVPPGRPKFAVFAGAFSGLYLTGLRLEGKFAYNVTFEKEVDWWNKFQMALTTAGLGFRSFGEITFHELKSGVFTANTPQRDMSKTNPAFGVDGFVFERPAAEFQQDINMLI